MAAMYTFKHEQKYLKQYNFSIGNRPIISQNCGTGVHTDWFNNILSILLLIFTNSSKYEAYVLVYTVFQKKWRQNSNHYNYGTPYQN